MIAVFVVILFACASADKMTLENFRQIPDNTYSDPADDIPVVNPDQLLPRGNNRPNVDDYNLSPRDRYLKNNAGTGKPITRESSEEQKRLWIDFEKLHDYMIQEQAKPGASTRKPYQNQNMNRRRLAAQFLKNDYQNEVQHRENEFVLNTFILNSENVHEVNATIRKYSIVWTTCDEFKNPSVAYDPEDITGYEWTPFYTWSDEGYPFDTVYKFQIPTRKQVYDYHTKLSPYLNRTIDWNKPKLCVQQGEGGGLEALLISVDDTGLYYCIWDFEVTQFMQRNKIIVETMTLRLKIVGNYLAMMHCEMKSAKIMARSSNIPKTNKEKREAAKILKFKGRGRPVTRNIEDEKEVREVMDDILKESTPMYPLAPKFIDAPTGRRHKNRGSSLSSVHGNIPGGPVRSR